MRDRGVNVAGVVRPTFHEHASGRAGAPAAPAVAGVVRPTFHEHAEHSLLEAHLLDFDGDLYGREVRVEFVDFIRSERKFEGIDQLAEQLARDVAQARTHLGLA